MICNQSPVKNPVDVINCGENNVEKIIAKLRAQSSSSTQHDNQL